MLLVEFLITFLTGIAVFLLGMKIMGEGLEKAASNKMRKVFSKISNNRFVGVGVGAGVTAIIHSSAATTVMSVGFVNAGVMTLTQATNIIMGANIGTTITGLLIALNSLNMALFMTIPAFIGIFMMMFFKKENLKQTGTIIAGMGIIFIGLNSMSSAVDLISDTAQFKAIFNSIDNPFFLMLIGIVVTAIIQSSTAVNAIIILLAVPVGVANGLDIVDGLYIILGTNVGTCITALIASAGTSTNAKRVSIFHLLFNVIGTVVFAIVFVFFKKEDLALFLNNVFGENVKFQIAWFNFFQNLICALLLLPFGKQLVRLTEIIIKDKPVKVTNELKYIDDRYLSTPTVAIGQVVEEVKSMFKLSKENFELSAKSFIELTDEYDYKINDNEKKINSINVGIVDFLVKVSGTTINASDDKLVAGMYHIVSDIERIGDHSINIMEFSQKMRDNNNFFSQEGKDEISQMCQRIVKMFSLTIDLFENKSKNTLTEIDVLEQIVDDMKVEYSTNHIKRLNDSICTAENGMIFYGALTDLERVADHIINISHRLEVKRTKTKVV